MASPRDFEPGTVHAVRRVTFCGRQRPILLQNENGPCPLIAIANTLFLLGRLHLPSHYGYVANSWIVEQVGLFIRANTASVRDAALAANMDHLVHDVTRLLPSLSRGMDVNPRFVDCESFEFTPELSVYDLCGVRLFHGWVVDDADPAAEVVSTLSINQAYNKLVGVREAGAPGMPLASPATTPFSPESIALLRRATLAEDGGFGCGDATAGTSAAALDSHDGSTTVVPPPTVAAPLHARRATSSGLLGAATLALRQTAVTAPTMEEDTPSAPSAPTAAAGGDADGGVAIACVMPGSTSPSIADAVTAAESMAPPPATALEPMVGAGAHEGGKSEDAFEEGLMLERWMRDNASQLTHTGLSQIAGRMEEGEVAVFFRNNHFATLYRRAGQLYLLVTDVGFRDVPEVVWELLNDVKGNTTYVDASFHGLAPPSPTTAPTTTTAAAMRAPVPVPAPAMVLPPGVELPPEFASLPASEREALYAALLASAGPTAPSTTTSSGLVPAAAPTLHPTATLVDMPPRPGPPPTPTLPSGTGTGRPAPAGRGGGAHPVPGPRPTPPPMSDSELAMQMQREEMRVSDLEKQGYIVNEVGQVVGRQRGGGHDGADSDEDGNGGPRSGGGCSVM